MRHLFIVNPAAGKYDRTHELRDKAESVAAGLRLSWDLLTTQAPGHATALAREAAEQGEPVRIYACGGDGTLNEVVNGAAGYEHVSVTHYPTGSGNDFIKIFGLDSPLFYDLRELMEGETVPLDLIDCNGRLALNICSVGLDARVGMGMADFKRIPFVTGPLAYQLSLVTNVIRGIHRPFRVTVDGEPFEGRFTLLCACNGRFYGGGFNPSPDAIPDDGVLEFLLVHAVSRFTAAQVVGDFSKGKAAQLPQFITLRRGREMRVECDRESIINIDGERMDANLLSFRLSAKKLNFTFPVGTSWNAELRRRTYEISRY